MGLLNFLDVVLDLLFGWTLAFHPALAILFLSTIIMLIITLITKYTTDQAGIRRIRDEQKKLQKDLKKYKNDQKKLMELQQRSMEGSFALMKKSMRATLFTIIPVLIIFGWMQTYLSVHPAEPNMPVVIEALPANAEKGIMEIHVPSEMTLLTPTNVTPNKTGTWQVQGSQGKYQVGIAYDGIEETKEIIIDTNLRIPRTKERMASPPFPLNIFHLLYSPHEPYFDTDSSLAILRVNYEPIHPLGGFNIFGWHPGFFGSYMIFSLVLSFGLRKLFNVA